MIRTGAVVAASLIALAALAEDKSCEPLAGDYAFIGQLADGSKSYTFGQTTNLVTVLFPSSALAYDTRIERYRLVLDQERVLFELHGSAGPLWRLNLADNKAYSYCLDGALVIEQQRKDLAGSIYEYSRYRHTLRRDERGDLSIATDLTGKYRTPLMSWERSPERLGARFARLEAKR